MLAAGLATLTLAGGCGSHQASSREAATVARAQTVDAEVASVLAGIPQRGTTLGYASAPTTLMYFADLQCPYCRRFTLGVLPSLIQTFVRTGKVKIQYRSFETATHDPGTFAVQQSAALAAGKQNKLWDFIDLFYHEQGTEDSGYVTESYLQHLAQQIKGLNLIEWTAARSDPELTEVLERDARAAGKAGINSTPTFLILSRSHTPYVTALEKALRGTPSGA
jgi:protein-disulfide isomerase